MLMNRTETWVVNNPVRGALQRWYEAAHPAPTRRAAAGGLPCRGDRLRGRARTVLILDSFGAGHVDAVDLDPR